MSTVESPRVRLRPFREADLANYAHWLAPHHAWRRFDGPYYGSPGPEGIARCVARARESITCGAEAQDGPGSLTHAGDAPYRAVIALRDDDRLIGAVTWYWIDEVANWRALGIDIYDDTLWGRGLGFEALGLWIDHLFAVVPELPRLDMRTWSGNIGMMRLADKVGFTLEARFRDAREINGERYDGLGYGILPSEWKHLHPRGFARTLE